MPMTKNDRANMQLIYFRCNIKKKYLPNYTNNQVDYIIIICTKFHSFEE